MSLIEIAQTLAANVAKTKGSEEKPKITLGCFHHPKYGTFNVNFKVNDSGCTLNLFELQLNDRNVFPECREVRKLAIEELERVITSHYKMEKEREEMMAVLRDECGSCSQKISNKTACSICKIGNVIKKVEGK